MPKQSSEEIYYSRDGEVIIGEEEYTEHLRYVPTDGLTALSDIWVGDAPLPSTHPNSFRYLTPEAYARIGRQIAKLMESEPLSGAAFDRGHAIGITPSAKQILRRFGSVPDFLDTLDEPGICRPGVFEHWTITDYVNDIRELGNAIDRRPSLGILRERARKTKGTKEPKPSPRIITTKIGMRQLYELAGYPHVQEFQEEDYRLWGVLFRMANGHEASVTNGLRYLSPKGKSPSTRSISNYFGSVGQYKEEVAAEFDRIIAIQRTPEQKASQVSQAIASGEVPAELFAGIHSEPDRDSVYAKYDLLNKTAPPLSLEKKKEIALLPSSFDFAIAVYEADRRVTPWKLQKEALLNGTFMDIWGQDYLDNIKVPVVKKAPRREQINGTVVLSTTVLPNGMVVKKLAAESPRSSTHSKRGNRKPGEAAPNSYAAKMVIERVGQSLEPGERASKSIPGTKGVRRPKIRRPKEGDDDLPDYLLANI